MIVLTYIILLVAIVNVHWDYIWYINKLVLIPFVSVVSATGFALVVWFMMAATKSIRIVSPPGGALSLLFLIGCLLSGVSLVIRSAPTDHYVQFGKSISHLTFYYVFVGTVFVGLRRLTTGKIMIPIVVLATPVCLLAIWQWAALNTGALPLSELLAFGCPQSEPDYGFRRVAGVFPEPSWFGFALVDWIGICLALRASGVRKNWLTIVLGLLVLCLFAANSMGAYVSLLGLIFVLAVGLLRGRDRLRFLLGGGALVLVVTMVLVFVSDINFMARLTAIFSGDDPSTHMRVTSATAALKTWMLNPISGVGFGNGQFLIAQFYESEFLLKLFQTGGFATSYGADSFWALLLAETGLIGAAGFIVLFAVFLRKPAEIRRMDGALTRDDEWDRLVRVYLTVRALVIVQLFQLSFQASFLSPRFWFYVTVLLVFKERVMYMGQHGRQRQPSS